VKGTAIMIKRMAVAMVGLALVGSASAYDLGPVAVHGTFSHGYVYSDDNSYIADSADGTFDFREYGLNAMWRTPIDRFQLGAQLFGREYGSTGNDQLYVDWAYADYRATDWAGLRAGRIRVPLGLYNETRDIDALRTEVTLPQTLYLEMTREVFDSLDGVGLYGTVPLAAAGEVGYQALYGITQMDADDGDFQRAISGYGLDPSDYGDEPGYAVALEWGTPVAGLRMVGSYFSADMTMDGSVQVPTVGPVPFSTPDGTIHAGAASIEYSVADWVFSAEWIKGTFEVDMQVGGRPAPDAKETFEGYYLRGDYRINPRLAAVGGYGYCETDTSKQDEDDYYAALRVDVTRYLILKVEEHYKEGLLPFYAEDNPDGVEDETWVTMAKATLYF